MKILKLYHVPVRADAEGAGFLAVLTEGAAKDQAVYVGITGHLDIKRSISPEYENTRFAAAVWIAGHGQKLTYAKALAYFPGLKENEYRA